jgi:hypothetical protein
MTEQPKIATALTCIILFFAGIICCAVAGAFLDHHPVPVIAPALKNTCPLGEHYFLDYHGFDREIGAGCYTDSEYIGILEWISPDDSACGKTLKTFHVSIEQQ